MSLTRLLALAVFAAAVVAGWMKDVAPRAAPTDPGILAVDFHVHSMPGDGMLPVWEVQREAARRGLDAIAITNHNHALAMRIARALNLIADYPIVIDGQELTTPAFHMAVVGAGEVIDWRLPAAEAIAAVRRGGGVAIAAHPGKTSWLVTGPDALRTVDGIEVAHPSVLGDASGGEEAEFRALYEQSRGLNPTVAPIGASDFHWGGPVGVCRSYVAVDAVSREGILAGVRGGRTVAVCPGGRVIGESDIVARTQARLSTEPAAHFGYGLSTWIAVLALIALGGAVLVR